MQLHDFIEAMTHIIGERFSVLDEEYVREVQLQLQEDIEAELRDFYNVRYVLIDPETGQLESRRSFESHEDASEAAAKVEYDNPDVAVLLN